MFNLKKIKLLVLASSSIALVACGGGGGDGGDETIPEISLIGSETITVEAGSTYEELTALAEDNIDGPIPIITSGTVDTSTLGTYTITYSATDDAGNTSSITRDVIVVDTTNPTISLVGNSEISLLINETFSDSGATAIDSFEGAIAVETSGTVDNTTLGSYTLTYLATDTSGNSSSITRTINVVSGTVTPDVTPPEITMNGSDTLTIEALSTYSELGASATDIEDGSVSVITSGTVDTSILGTYTITYTATDEAENTSSITRDVTVQDTISPSISLSGSTTIELLAGEVFSEPGFTATDSFEGPTTVVAGGTVGNTPNTYTLTYNATDSSGNAATTKTRTVTVLPSILLSVQAKDYFSGSSIQNASISVSTTEDGSNVIRTGITDENGELSIPVADDAQRITVSGDAEGYGEYSEIITSVAQVVDIFLQPINAEVSFTPSTESNLDVSGLSIVTLPANSLVDADGNAPTGDLSAELTIIDPSVDANLMPGNFETIDSSTGIVGNIESFGAVNVTFDDEDGNSYNLSTGQTATVRIPLASDATSPPATIPLYYFNQETGYWVEEGTATLMNVGGEQYYEGTVAHFSTWNADYLYESVLINGCIEDNEGNPVYLAEVQTQGQTYSGQASTTSDTDGNFSVAAKANSTVLLFANTPNGLSRTTTIYTGTEDQNIDECMTLEASAAVVTLTWGDNPRDLDTQFFGPNSETGEEAFLMYYANKAINLNTSSIWLDVDDTSSYGPEITTISSFPYAGRYTYAVKLYSGSSDIAASPARVVVDFGGQRQIFTPPEGEPTRCWSVFDFVVDTEGEITVETNRTWESTNYCSAREYNSDGSDSGDISEEEIIEEISEIMPLMRSRTLTTPTLETKSGILKEMIDSKYYTK